MALLVVLPKKSVINTDRADSRVTNSLHCTKTVLGKLPLKQLSFNQVVIWVIAVIFAQKKLLLSILNLTLVTIINI